MGYERRAALARWCAAAAIATAAFSAHAGTAQEEARNGALADGITTAVGLAAGAAWGAKTWNDSERERQFWESCAALREYAQRPDMPCIYNEPGQPPANAHEITVQLIEEASLQEP